MIDHNSTSAKREGGAPSESAPPNSTTTEVATMTTKHRSHSAKGHQHVGCSN